MNKKLASLLVGILLIAVTILQVSGNPIGFTLVNDADKGRDNIPPTIVINFAGNPGDMGGPFWQPPGESMQLTGIFSSGYYTNDSKQSEDWIYVNLTVTDDSAIDAVWLNWLNETSWTNWTYQCINTEGNFWEFNTSNNIKTFEGYLYSFNIVANDTSGNTNSVRWSKTGLGEDNTRRYVQLNCTTTNFSYIPYYLHSATYGEEDLYSIANNQFTYDRLHHDQGPGATLTDCGLLNKNLPTDIVEERHSTHYVDFWFDETICADSDDLHNIYYHVWWSSDNENLSEVGWHKNCDNADGIFTDGYSTDISFNRAYSTIYYNNADNNYNHNYGLETRPLDTTLTSITDNNIYEISVKLEAAPSFFDWHYPSVISNRSFTSFILFNVPDNDTLNATIVDSDNDGLHDWDELYTTYTNPFLADTDNDGVSDYNEHLSGSDPNNWIDAVAPNNPPYTPSNPNPEDHATNVNINVDLSWTGEDPNPGDTVTYDAYFGTTSPPPQVVWGQSGTMYDPGTMNHNTQYYWQIVAWDNHGESTSGPIWDFTTEEELNQPPNTPNQPSGPASGYICISYNYSTFTTDPDGDNVKYGWDWDGDLVVDEWTDWYNSGDTCTVPHSWDDPSTYDVRVKAKDIYDAESGWSDPLTITMVNHPPYEPSDPDPPDGATNVTSGISWTGGDPDSCDTVTYDVYFGTTSPPPLVVSGQSGTTYSPGTMTPNTQYYWKIVAWDNHGEDVEGPIWSFTTMEEPNQPPYVPSNPNPEDHATNVSINVDLSWTSGDPDPGDTVTYDVFFGMSSPPPQVTWNQPDTTYNPGTLDYEQTYYWKIIAWDNHGEHTEGPMWTFTTTEEPNNPPYIPSNPSPSDEAIDVPIDANLSWTGGDPDPEDTITYDVYFGTNNPPPQIVNNQSEAIFDPDLNYNTTYYWRIISWDNHGEHTEGPIWSFMTVEYGQNQPPSTPQLSGPTIGGAEIDFNFSAVATDPEGDQIYYNFSWGEGNFTGWLGPFNPSENVTTNNSWDNFGEYGIKVKAKDSNDMESDWSEIHTISISQLIEIDNLKLGFLYFRLHLFEKESYAYLQLLQQLGFSFVIGTEIFEINTTASSDVVDSVIFIIFDAIWEENITEEDNDSSDGFSTQLELASGIYEITIFAYDSEGNLIDRQNISYVVNICLKESGNETLRPISRMRERLQRINERRAHIRSLILKA